MSDYLIKASSGALIKASSGALIKASGSAEFWTDERCYITELCGTPLHPQASLALARVEAGVTTQLHALTDTQEVYIVTAGAGRMEVAGEVFEIGVGDQVVIPPGVAQRVTALGDEDLKFYCLCTPRFQPGCYTNLEPL